MWMWTQVGDVSSKDMSLQTPLASRAADVGSFGGEDAGVDGKVCGTGGRGDDGARELRITSSSFSPTSPLMGGFGFQKSPRVLCVPLPEPPRKGSALSSELESSGSDEGELEASDSSDVEESTWPSLESSESSTGESSEEADGDPLPEGGYWATLTASIL